MIDTKLLTESDNDLKIAADILNSGGTVIFPTETVYGLGANALDPIAVKKIFEAKGRPADNPLIVHISDISMLDSLVVDVPQSAWLVAEKFWPGPITIILNKCKNVPYETSAGLNTVAIRFPGSKTAQRLISASGIPIAAPSANLSGKPSPTTVKHCIDDMTGRVDAIIRGDDCEIGVESTVLDLSGDTPTLLRTGKITLEQLRDLLGEVDISDSAKDGEAPKSPGQKYKHYAPKADVFILSGSLDNAKDFINKQAADKKVGMLVFDEFPEFENAETISLSSINDPSLAAHNLFSALRRMDELSVDVIYAPEIADNGIWRAVRNRLYRAAGERIIKLDKKKILFICTGNTCRSPMAQALFNDICNKINVNAEADSAGLYADGSLVSENTVNVLSELGIDISGRSSKQITKDMIDNADLVLTMTSSHKIALTSTFGKNDKIKTLAEFSGYNYDVSDPFGGDVDVYRSCRDLMNEMIKKAVAKL